MATVYKIHPAIGIARLGNSPNEFFIGPERIGELPEPQGGFKDAQCRIKRQAARFRIFAHHDDDTVEEITDAEAEITWTVHVANSKAAYAGRGNTESADDLTIDPGPRTTTGPNQQRVFDGGEIQFSGQADTEVPLGEMRTDTQNRLLVLGGVGKSASPGGNGIADFWANAGWYDDIADGAVSASIKLHATNATPPVEGAWVIVGPPKFAPHQDSITTLYDRVLQAMVDAGLATAPATTSYSRDVYPILQRTRDIKWVRDTHEHTWTEPVVAPALRSAIFNRLGPADMPLLAGGDSSLTAIQHTHMERWKDGNFDNDWAGVPAPQAGVTPEGLDRMALEACVGASFFPGIEAGGKSPGNRPIVEAAFYSSAFRINHATVAPGSISASMALPWQADFYACTDVWWPVPRPGKVFPQGTSSYASWTRDVNSYADMVAKWHALGFVVKQGGQHVEVERCDTPSITLMTPHLDFVDVQRGPMGMVREHVLAISFEVISPSASITLEYAPSGGVSHPQLVAHNTSVTVGPTGGTGVATARLWVIYRTGALGSSIPTQAVTVREPVSGQTWSITIDANTVERKTAAVALVLDRSGSMAQDRGDGQSKHISLQKAAETFVDVMLEGDGVGLVRYDHDAQVVQEVMMLGAGGLSDTNRNNTIDLINGNSFDPAGATSIGDGIFEGRQILSNATGTFDNKALAVLTDGVENRSRYIADVAADINERTYAIGLGTPQNTSAAALQSISGNNGGYLLVTGAIGTDNRFMLQKYFLQVLAGVSNAEVVLDPDGLLVPGAVHRVPFMLTEADSGVDVILLTPDARVVDFRLQTPAGRIIEPWRADQEPAMRFVMGNGATYYRLALPLQLQEDRFDHAGTWHALLTIGKPRIRKNPDNEQGIDTSILQGMHADAAVRIGHKPEYARMSEQQRQYALAQEAAKQSGKQTGKRAAARRETAAAATTGQGRTVPYSLIVHSYSSVSLRAALDQAGYEPGARVQVQATLTQSGIPLQGEAQVWAELTRADGIQANVPLVADGTSGRHAGEFVAATAGVHRLRVRALGRTRDGNPFTREQTLTAVVWSGGDGDAETGSGGMRHWIDVQRERDERLCGLLNCLTPKGGVIGPEMEKRLREQGVDLGQLRKCLEAYCRAGRTDNDRRDG